MFYKHLFCNFVFQIKILQQTRDISIIGLTLLSILCVIILHYFHKYDYRKCVSFPNNQYQSLVVTIIYCYKRSRGNHIWVGAMPTNEGNVKIEKFDGTNFGFWKMQIEDYLCQKKMYQPLSGNKPEDMKD